MQLPQTIITFFMATCSMCRAFFGAMSRATMTVHVYECFHKLQLSEGIIVLYLKTC